MAIDADKMIKLLQGSDAQHPVSAEYIAMKMGMTPEATNAMLDHLYAGKAINQATVTKLNSTQRMVWLTITAKAGKHVFDSPFRTGTKAPPTPIRREQRPTTIKDSSDASENKRPDETATGGTDGTGQHEHEDTAPIHIPAVTGPAIIEENIMETTIEQIQKSKVQQILEYIEANPDCSYSEVTKGCSVSGVDAFLIGYFNRGQVVKWNDEQGKKRYRLADGMNAETVLSGKPKPGRRAAAVIEPPVSEAPVKAVLMDKDPFKCAFTSDGTLLLFGIAAVMIELDQAQTSKLLELVRPHLDIEVTA